MLTKLCQNNIAEYFIDDFFNRYFIDYIKEHINAWVLMSHPTTWLEASYLEQRGQVVVIA
jgi:hypothetical protein